VIRIVRAIFWSICIICLSLVAPQASLAECKAPDAVKNVEIVTYVMKKYQVASSSDLVLANSAKANDACFWKMEYATSIPKRSIVLYLSPDRKYLLPVLYDLSLDPLAEMRAKNEELSRELTTGANPGKGPTAAPVTIVEFSDFECPYCKRMTDLLEKEVLPKEGDKVKVVFRNFPLPMHPWAKDAAEMAECAALQKPEAFWVLHDFFFQNQQSLRPDNLRTQVVSFVANNKDLNQPQFEACINRELGMGPVTQDQQLGQKIGIHGTPTVFVNGVRFDGLRSADELETIIEKVAKGELVAPPERAPDVAPEGKIASSRPVAAQCAPLTRTGGTTNAQ
jgi:protein-disulfide isomerase